MKAPRRAFRLDKHPDVRPKMKRYLRSLIRQQREAHDDRYPDTARGERLVALHRALARRRAKNKVAKASRKANR